MRLVLALSKIFMLCCVALAALLFFPFARRVR